MSYIVHFDTYMIPTYSSSDEFSGNVDDILDEFQEEIDAKTSVMQFLKERIVEINSERTEAELFLQETKAELAIIRERLEEL